VIGCGDEPRAAVGGALGAAEGTGEDLDVGLEPTTPVVHALARNATAIEATKEITRE